MVVPLLKSTTPLRCFHGANNGQKVTKLVWKSDQHIPALQIFLLYYLQQVPSDGGVDHYIVSEAAREELLWYKREWYQF